MSTIVIIGGGGGGTPPTLVANGNEIKDGNGLTVATFNTPEQAIAYLKVLSKQQKDLES